MEGSYSVEKYGVGNFRRLIDFVRTMTVGFTVSKRDARIATVVYGTKPYKLFGFRRYPDIRSVYNALSGVVRYPRDGSRTGRALSFAWRQVFKRRRRRAAKVLVVITDGKSLDDVHYPSRMLRLKGVTIFSVGVGRYFNAKELDSMATDPDKNHVFTSDWKQLQHIANDLRKAICLGESHSSIDRISIDCDFFECIIESLSNLGRRRQREKPGQKCVSVFLIPLQICLDILNFLKCLPCSPKFYCFHHLLLQ